jgi:O-methyltransferase involved in polyketide biosynthesis
LDKGGPAVGYGFAVAAERVGDSISPTAHYTGFVWARNGMSDPAFVTREGRLLYSALAPLNVASAATGGPTLEGFLLARHRLIDHLLTEAIEAGRVSQVIEIAAGLSPRGWRFTERYADRLTYLETDLAGMVARKRAVLGDLGSLSDRHRVVELNALAHDGPLSLAALAARLDPAQGTAIITEGLLNYFDTDAVLGMWQRFAEVIRRFPDGCYLSDLHVRGDSHRTPVRVFMAGLSAFVRGRVHLHFGTAAEAGAALRACGFDHAALHRPTDFPAVIGGAQNRSARLVRVIEAS